MKTKKCNRCKVTKEVIEFPKSSFNKSGYGSPCKECGRKLSREWIKESNYTHPDPERNRKNQEEWRNNNRERIKDWYNKNRESIVKKQSRRMMEQYHNDPVYRLKSLLRSLVYRALKQNKIGKRTEEVLGCTFEQAKHHLEKQFSKGMSWDNTSEWEIDHIVPLSFAQTEEEAIMLSHYSNLQPLWMVENRRKRDRIREKGKQLLKEWGCEYMLDR